MDHVRLPADGPVSASDVVDYARRISYTTFAPVGYVAGAPLHGVMPPAPQDEHFHASHLARHAVEVKARNEARAARESKMAAEARKAAAASSGGVGGEAPPIETIIKLLSTWKPGQPWPAGIPPPPPGWKPGDPLHIGGAAPSGGARSAGEGVKPQAAAAETVGTAAAAGTAAGVKAKGPPPSGAAPNNKPAPVKVVPFIQLDLNPDLEDADDDFGSDEFEEVSGSDNDDSDSE